MRPPRSALRSQQGLQTALGDPAAQLAARRDPARASVGNQPATRPQQLSSWAASLAVPRHRLPEQGPSGKITWEPLSIHAAFLVHLLEEGGGQQAWGREMLTKLKSKRPAWTPGGKEWQRRWQVLGSQALRPCAPSRPSSPLRSVWGYFYFRLSSFMKTPHHSYS